MMGDLTVSVRRYVKSMLDRVSGFKVLILDEETTGIVSLVYGQSDILEKEVYLVEKIDNEGVEKQPPMRHLNAIFFLRPNSDNILRIVKELKDRRFGEYHLIFSSSVSNSQLERIAKSDEQDVIQQIQVFFADIFVINPTLFSLELPSLGLLSIQDNYNWTTYEESLFRRIQDGLLSSVLCSIKNRFLGIRYSKESELCRKLSYAFQQRLIEEIDVVNDAMYNRSGITDGIEGQGNGLLILMYDRRDDPVTPLLNQWTYQSMTHELIGIMRNRVQLMVPNSSQDTSSSDSDIVLSISTDPFFARHWNSNFGDLGVAIQDYVKSYQQHTKSTANIESIEDMKEFVEKYPEFRKLAGNVSKHVALVHELSRLVEANGLLEGSLIEQQIACSDNRNDHLKSVVERLRNHRVSRFEKLRLVLLYAIRHEGDPYIQTLRHELTKSDIEPQQADIVEALLTYAGAQKPASILFQDTGLIQMARNVVNRSFKGVPNVYTQHTPFLASVVENLIKGKLKESQYPFALPVTGQSSNDTSRPSGFGMSNAADKPSEILVFVVGGATYQEACDLQKISAQYNCVVFLGGTTIHNTKSFLADVAQLGKASARFNGGKKPSFDSWEASASKQNQKKQSNEMYSITVDASTRIPSSTDYCSNKAHDREAELVAKREFLRQKW